MLRVMPIESTGALSSFRALGAFKNAATRRRSAHPFVQQLAVIARSMLLLVLVLALPLTGGRRTPAAIDLPADRTDHFSLACKEK